jgi:type IV pilus assembly protein PilQ
MTCSLCLVGVHVGVVLAENPPDPQSENSGLQTEIKVSDRGAVQLHVTDMPLATVLRLLSIQSRRNIIATPNVKGTVTANLFNVTFEEALDAVLRSNGAGFRAEGGFIYVYTHEELAALAPSGDKPITRVFKLSYISSADAQTYLTPLLGDADKIAVSPAARTGIASDANEAGSNSNVHQDVIVVQAHPATMLEIERVLKQIDVRPKQVLIEATIVRAELKDDNSLGIDFSLVGGVDLELLGATSNGGTQLSLGQLPQNRLEQFNAAAVTGFTGDVPDNGVRFGIIKDNVAVFLQALEEVTNTTVIANPKVLALNKQKGQVIVGRRDGYLTTTVTETQSVQTVEFLETGTQLFFRPFIGEDGYVRVELHPEDSVGLINAQGLPSEQTTEVTTNVIVRDGDTILIGGLFRELSSEARSQVPGLGSVPGIGTLFRSQSDSTGREEVLILLTIHVVKDDAAYADESRQTLDDIEQLRVGLRRGLMWHGRERLAQSHYRRALRAREKGQCDRALWHADLSLHNLSNFTPAMELRESLLQQRAWDEDNAAHRDFVFKLIARDRGYPLDWYDRPRRAMKADEQNRRSESEKSGS